MAAAAQPRSVRIPALDGWRGIAILLVLIEHFQDGIITAHHRPVPWLSTGVHGVTAFFVLSGFLITTGLVDSRTTLQRFYVRRFFRLMPVAWAFLAFLAGLGIVAAHLEISFRELLSCVFFWRNYYSHGGLSLTGPFWSLSIEEQFYLVWPVILLACGPKRGKWIAAIAAIACWTWCSAHSAFYDSHRVWTEVHAPAILTGCFLGISLRDEHFRQRFTSVCRWLFWPCLAYLIWSCTHDHPIPSPLECVAWGVVICYSAVAAPGILNWQPLTWLGRVSYSLYVWNYLILLLVGIPHGAVIALFLAPLPFLSYYWIERPAAAVGIRLLSHPAPPPLWLQPRPGVDLTGL